MAESQVDGSGSGPSWHGGASSSPGPLGRMADVVAGFKVSVYTKLLGGFLIGAILLLGMAVLSLVILSGMSQQVEELTRLQENVDTTRQMNYLVTAQSHFRAMALLTEDDANNDKIANAKGKFASHLDSVERASRPGREAFFDDVREVNDRFAQSSAHALALYEAGDVDQALEVHLAEEHLISHELEEAMAVLIEDASGQMAVARDNFQSDRRMLTWFGWTFSGVSLVSALLLGFILSLAFIRPVRRIDHALAQIAAGDFRQRVEVPNRDEFGTLSSNLNRMSAQLADLYEELRGLNENLQEKVDAQVEELERATRLRRYLSPQLAEPILAGSMDVTLASRRQSLTVLFCDIRGFTEMSERVEPEDLVDMLNQSLTAMTEIVFKYGGTLDKYLGDGLMAFFGNPAPHLDHAERAVKTALEMQESMVELQRRWFVRTQERFAVGIGISTGHVTVGNIGSPTRMDYTVLGNHVNLAARLVAEAKPGQILVSEWTLAAAQDVVEGSEVDQVHLEGVNRPVGVYEVRPKPAADSG